MTTVRKIQDNHIIVIKELLNQPVLDDFSDRMTSRVVTARMARLHSHWFSLSKREIYRIMERKVS